MKTIEGYPCRSGFVSLAGPLITERMRRAEAAKPESWPWPGPYMEGDARVALAWPEREPGKAAATVAGQIGLAVMDPMMKMRIVGIWPFDTATSRVEDAGKDFHVVEGAGKMVARAMGLGVRRIIVQADDVPKAEYWIRCIREDASMRGVPRPHYNSVSNLDLAMGAFREMQGQIVMPAEYNTEIGRLDAQGVVGPMLLCVAMLALSCREVAFQALATGE